MVKSYVITISELDDIDDAIIEYRNGLENVTLLRNTVGIISTHREYMLSGIYSALAKEIDFPIIGTTTLSQSTKDETAAFLLTIMILTSDDCEFSCGYSDTIPQSGDIREDITQMTQDCYHKLRARLSSDAKLALLYVPPLKEHYPNKYVTALSACDINMPIFGTVANDETDTFFDSRVLFNGEEYNDRFALLLISGEISPKFYIGPITDDSIIVPDIGEITSSLGNILFEINNMNALNFLANMGFVVGQNRNRGLLSSVFMLRLKDESDSSKQLIARSLVSIYQGTVIFGGEVPNGAVISIGTITEDVVMATAQKVVSEITANNNGGTALIYACVGRRYALLNEPLKELTYIRNSLPDGFTYVAACSSGEICPTETDIKVKNFEHNQTLVACVF